MYIVPELNSFLALTSSLPCLLPSGGLRPTGEDQQPADWSKSHHSERSPAQAPESEVADNFWL